MQTPNHSLDTRAALGSFILVAGVIDADVCRARLVYATRFAIASAMCNREGVLAQEIP